MESGGCQVNSEVILAVYVLVLSSVCVWRRPAGQGTRHGVVSWPAAPVTWNKRAVVGRSCDCVCSTLVMWCELRAGSEKCWVALRGSFHPGSRQKTSMHTGRGECWSGGWMSGQRGIRRHLQRRREIQNNFCCFLISTARKHHILLSLSSILFFSISLKMQRSVSHRLCGEASLF